MNPKELAAAKKELEQIKSLQEDITKNSARYNAEGKLGKKATQELIKLEERRIAVADLITRAEKENLKTKKEEAKESARINRIDKSREVSLAKIVKSNRENQGFSKNMFGLSSRINTLAKDNIVLISEENKQKGISSDLADKLTQATLDIATGNLDVLGLKDQQKELEEELVGLDAEKDKNAISRINNALALNKVEQQRVAITEQVNAGLKEGDTLIGGMGSTIMGFVTNPLTAVVALLALFSTQLGQIGDEFGALGVKGFRKDLMGAGMEFQRVGLESKEALSSVRELSDTFGIAFQDSISLADSVADLAKSTGMATNESAKLLGLFTEIGGLTEEGAVELAKQAESLAVANGVAPATVLKDIAKNSEVFAKFSGAGAEGLTRAAIQARKLGIEFSSVATAAENILDFESSLNAEVEASVMLGRQVNLQKARELALTDDIEGFQKEILKQVGSQAEFDKMNVLQKKALAQATGLSVEELSKMVSKEKEAATLAGKLSEQKIEDIIPANTLDDFARLVNEVKALGIQFASTLGPAISSIATPIASLLSGLADLNLLFPLVAGAIGLYTLNSIAATVATTKQTIATLSLITAKQGEDAATKKGMLSKMADIGMSMRSAGTKIFEAIANAGAGAAKIAAMIPIAGFIIGGALLAGFIGYLLGQSNAAKTAAGDFDMKANQKPTFVTGEGQMFSFSKNDDVLAAPGLSAAVNGMGNTTIVNTDTSAIEKGTMETNQTLKELKEVLLGQPKEFGKRMDGALSNQLA